MKIEYELKDAGWALVTVSTRSEAFTVRASYLNDSLAELINAAINLGADTNKAVIVFINEPGEHQLVLQKVDAETVHAALYWFSKDRFFEEFLGLLEPEELELVEAQIGWLTESEYKDSHKQKQELLLQATIKVRMFQHDVLYLLEGILREHGLAGYKEKWRGDFPIVEYERLKRLLGK